MDLELIIFIIIMCWAIFYWIVYIIFGQVLVRKLRKNPITKKSLGLEFVSGWDILNVAFSLSYPVWMREVAKKSPLSFLEADYDAIYPYTTRFDRVLAKIIYCMTGAPVLFELGFLIFETITGKSRFSLLMTKDKIHDFKKIKKDKKEHD
ncbi:hypothetical protein [Desulfuromonas sp. CSMB_57]|uniref:hypothetical protein n=1 Tax=Desulfuromonas sp. CSMB_57 TaxID=2807629 RepID=UPI0020C08572|nr:hypothetical protein [Desulfuromonas sp. CSMB_57]